MLQANVAEKILKGDLTSTYKTQSSIIPEFNISTSVISKTLSGKSATIWVTSGNVWIDGLGRLDLSSTNGLKCTAGTVFETVGTNTVTFISDVTGGKAQIVLWQ